MREQYVRLTSRSRKCLAFLCLASLAFSLTACVSGFLQKYRSPSAAASLEPKGEAKGLARKAPSGRAGIVAIDAGTFRIPSSYDRVWDALLDVLLRNYNLAIADRPNGLITTEWDSYYLDGKVHRNKVSLRLKRLAVGSELLVYNNVEVLTKMPDGGITEIWLPTDRTRAEVIRLVQNTALALNLPQPDLPLEPVAAQPSGTSPAPAAHL